MLVLPGCPGSTLDVVIWAQCYLLCWDFYAGFYGASREEEVILHSFFVEIVYVHIRMVAPH